MPYRLPLKEVSPTYTPSGHCRWWYRDTSATLPSWLISLRMSSVMVLTPWGMSE